MSNDFRVKDFEIKSATARTDAADVASLGKCQKVSPFQYFKVGKDLFVWSPFDLTPPDGTSCIRREAAHPKAPGRYRRVSSIE